MIIAELGHALSGIVPERVLTINSVNVDDIGIRVNYTVEPAYPDEAHIQNTDISAVYEWRVDVDDDIDTSYLPGGGAAGRDKGVKTVMPAPPMEASGLRILVRPALQEEPCFVLKFATKDLRWPEDNSGQVAGATAAPTSSLSRAPEVLEVGNNAGEFFGPEHRAEGEP